MKFPDLIIPVHLIIYRLIKGTNFGQTAASPDGVILYLRIFIYCLNIAAAENLDINQVLTIKVLLLRCKV
jgi:hypothetical protein